MSNSTDKSRKVYKRNDVVHVCFAGSFYAPADSGSTAISPPAKAVASLNEDGSLTVASGEVSETWAKAEVPRGAPRARRAKGQAEETSQVEQTA
jgi:hypothetical protein